MIEHLEALAKIPLYGGLLIIVGAAVGLWLVPRAEHPPSAAHMARLASAGSTAILVFLLARLLAHTVSTFPDEGLSLKNLSLIALQSRWGRGWRLQLVAAVVATVVARSRVWNGSFEVRRSLTPLLAILLTTTFPLLGHAAGSTARESIAATHLLAVGAWLGTLVVLWLVGTPSLWPRFSKVALVGASGVVLSGVLLALNYLTSWRDLFETTYGRTLLLKITLFLGILVCGALNWRTVQQDGPPRAVRVEAGLAALVIVVTAVLTEMAHP